MRVRGQLRRAPQARFRSRTQLVEMPTPCPCSYGAGIGKLFVNIPARERPLRTTECRHALARIGHKLLYSISASTHNTVSPRLCRKQLLGAAQATDPPFMTYRMVTRSLRLHTPQRIRAGKSAGPSPIDRSFFSCTSRPPPTAALVSNSPVATSSKRATAAAAAS